MVAAERGGYARLGQLRLGRPAGSAAHKHGCRQRQAGLREQAEPGAGPEGVSPFLFISLSVSILFLHYSS
jgi:hypothetical protein